MASAAVDSNGADVDVPLRLDSIPTIDLNLISQSELYALSLCSSSAFDPRRCDGVVIPKIDRSVFNESAGSRKQTYSRLRLTPAASPNSPCALRRRGPVLRSANYNRPIPCLDSDPEVGETRQIVGLLKQLFGVEENSISNNDDYIEVGDQLVPVRVDYSDTIPQTSIAGASGLKRKRGRPPKHDNAVVLVENKVESLFENSDTGTIKMNEIVVHESVEDGNRVCRDPINLAENKMESICENGSVGMVMNNEIVVHQNLEDGDKEMVNRDGVMVDLVGLGFMEDPYGEELGRRTVGMGREEELLAFLNGLNGEWVSRRKKRRIVDASEFGNALPEGWRLMLACKKKGGLVWIFCRRYLSPNGRQFASCKEISAYLLSLHGSQDASQRTCTQQNLEVGKNNVNFEAADKIDVTNTAVLVVSNDSREENDVSRFLSQAFASMSGDYGAQVSTGGQDEPVVQVGSSLCCDRCNMTFNFQDDLLHHQLSSHRGKRSKASITDGVIIKEGKFECQFCHKTFDERKRYNGHMGSHVRNQVKVSDGSQAADVKEAGGTVSGDGTGYRDSLMQTLNDTESNIASKVTGKGSGDQFHSYLPQSTIDKHSGDTEPFEEKSKFDNAKDMDYLENDKDLGSEAALSNSETRRPSEIPGHTSLDNEASNECENFCNEQEKISEDSSPLPLDKQTNSLVSHVVAVGGEKSGNEQTRTSEGCLPLPFDKQAGIFVSNETVDESEKSRIEQERVSESCPPPPLDEKSGSFDETDGSEKHGNEQEQISEGCSPRSLDKQAGSFDDMINDLFDCNRDTISGSALHASNENLESCDIDWDSADFSHTMDELGLDENKMMDNDPVLGFSGKSGADDSSFVGGKLHSGYKGNSCGNVNFVNGKSFSINKGSEQKTGYESNKLASSCGKEIDNDKGVYGFLGVASLVVDEHDKMHMHVTKDHARSAEYGRDIVDNLEKDRGAKVTEICNTEISSGDLKGRMQSKGSKSMFTSSVRGSFGMDEHVDKVSSRMIQEHRVNDARINDNAELGFPLPKSNNGHNMHAVSEDKDETKFGFRSFFPSENRKLFPADGNRVSPQSCTVEESKDQLLARSCALGSPHEAYGTNKIFPAQLNQHGNSVAKNFQGHGLGLAFDSQASSSVNQLEQYGAKSSGIHTGMDQTYGVPHNLNNFVVGAAGNPMEGMGFGVNLRNLSFSDKSTKFGNSFDIGYPDRIGVGARLNETVNSSNKFMVDYVNRNPQSAGDVTSGTIWRTGEANLLQHNVTNASPPLVQSSNNFHTFDIISEKGHGGLFEVNQKYSGSGGFEMLTLGRTEPTEYTFMATQNSNSLPGESKDFSYDVHSQPAFASPFWLGKDALMPSMPLQNRVSTVCVWCRSEFYEDTMPSAAAQTGAIGSMCPTCSSRISQQFNVL